MVGSEQSDQLKNSTVGTVMWENTTVTVKDRQSKQPKDILSNVHGMVKAGELFAIMGPSCVSRVLEQGLEDAC